MERRTFLTALGALPLARYANRFDKAPGSVAIPTCLDGPITEIQLPVVLCERQCSCSEGIRLASKFAWTCDRAGDHVQFADQFEWSDGVLRYAFSNRASHRTVVLGGESRRLHLFAIADHYELIHGPIKMRPGIRTVEILADGSYGHFRDSASQLDAGQWLMLSKNAPRIQDFGPIDRKSLPFR